MATELIIGGSLHQSISDLIRAVYQELGRLLAEYRQTGTWPARQREPPQRPAGPMPCCDWSRREPGYSTKCWSQLVTAGRNWCQPDGTEVTDEPFGVTLYRQPERGLWEAQLRERPIAGYYET